MNEFIYVEFLFDWSDTSEEKDINIELQKLGNDFEMINPYMFLHDDGNIKKKFTGKIRSDTATMIKLSNPPLAKCMHVSYIPAELKNKYRN